MKKKLKKGGIYLVIDPSMECSLLIKRLSEALTTSHVCAVQLWDNWKDHVNQSKVVVSVKELCKIHDVPLLANNDRALCEQFDLDGLHLDFLPEAGTCLPRTENLLLGLTLRNDLSALQSVLIKDIDYLSFCSVFPSSTAGVACEIVSRETIETAAKLTELPIFLSGGINKHTIPKLEGLNFHGLAVISGVMNSPEPALAIGEMIQSLNEIRKPI